VPPIVPNQPTSLGSAQPPKPARPPVRPAAPMTAPVSAAPVSPETPIAVPGVELPVAPASEAVAVDAFDAFDMVWSDPAPAQAEIPAERQSSASPSVDESLGSTLDATSLDGEHPWTEELTVPGEPMSAATTADETTADETPTHPTPGFAMPAWLSDDPPTIVSTSAPAAAELEASATPTEAVQPETPEMESGTWPVANEYDYSAADWAAASALPPADEITRAAATSLGERSAPEVSALPTPAWAQPAIDTPEPVAATPAVVAEESPRFELVDEHAPAVPNTDAPADPRVLHGLRVSATLDRLAQRVRNGEIDLSFVAPDASDAAVLASVLAALLGGSSSR